LSELDLIAFLKRAIDFGQHQFLATAIKDRLSISLGETSFDFAESEYSLKPCIEHCLSSSDSNRYLDSKIKIYADYSGWYLQDEFMQRYILDDIENNTRIKLEAIGIRVIYSPKRQAWDIFDTFNFFGIRLLPNKSCIEPWEPTSPLAYFCKWVAEIDNKTIIHAGSLSINGVGALIIGNGGAGKSGTIIGSMKHGFKSSGDDYTLLSKKSNTYRAYAVYRTVKQDVSGLQRLNIPISSKLNWQNKAVFRPEKVFSNCIVDSVPIHMLIMPSLGGTETTFHPINPVTVFKTLTISTLKQLCGGYAPMFVACAQLIHDVPCYGLTLSPDASEVSLKLKNFIEDFKC